MVKSSAKDVFMWALGGALIGGAAGFAVMYLWLSHDTRFPGLAVVAFPFSALFAVFTGMVGGGIGAVAESVVHARRKRR